MEAAHRILEHPILGPLPAAEAVTVHVDGEALSARRGETIAAVLVAHGRLKFRSTEVRHEPRGIYCAIGKCTDCVMTVDGMPNVRTCVTLVEDGMTVTTQEGLGTWATD